MKETSVLIRRGFFDGYSVFALKLAFAVARYPAERLVLWGESLGSALATNISTNSEPDMEKNQSPSDERLVRKNFENNPMQGSEVT